MRRARPLVLAALAATTLSLASSATVAATRGRQPRQKLLVFVRAANTRTDIEPAGPVIGDDGKVSVRVLAAVRDEESGLSVLRAKELLEKQEDLEKRVQKSAVLRLVRAGEEPALKLIVTDVHCQDYLPRDVTNEYASTFRVESISYRVELAGTGYAYEGTASTRTGWFQNPIRDIVGDIEEWVEGGVVAGRALRVFDAKSLEDSVRDISECLKRSRWLQQIETESGARLVITVLRRRAIGYGEPIFRIDYRLTVPGTDYETESHVAGGVSAWSTQEGRLVRELEAWVEDNYETLARQSSR